MWFELFDPDTPVSVARRNIPHWFQPGVACFVTFRTADSLPAAVVDRWLATRREWLRTHGIDPDAADWQARLRRLPTPVQKEFHRTFSDAFHHYLDAGYGECVLRRPEVSEIVSSALLHFEGVRYHMSDFVVMPNHVHALFGLIGETPVGEVCYSWKKYTATKINAALGTRGHFWQGESFDHLVRTPEQFEYLRDYIADNPKKAGLKPGEYRHYRAELSANVPAEG